MDNISILFSDKVHFHDGNFKSLFGLISRHNIPHTFITKRDKWCTSYGNYTDLKSELSNIFVCLSQLNLDELINYEHEGINIFSCAKAELLSYLITKRKWYNNSVPGDNLEIISLAYQRDIEHLLLNLSATISWIDFWKRTLRSNRNHSHCCVFSGSLIYTSTLLEVLKSYPTTPIVMESFFTGNEYYFEERYSHLANNSDLSLPNVFNKAKESLPQDPDEWDRVKTKAINKVLNSHNKNVRQPSEIKTLPFQNSESTVTILGQVLNDFSILESDLPNINSLGIYKELIYELVKNTEYNIIFKAHPWERNKKNMKNPISKLEIYKYIERQFTEEERSRIFITENFNLNTLLKKTDFAISICSQSSLEAAFLGLKPIQLGRSFFGKKGFTYDYIKPKDVINDLKHDKIIGNLSLTEYNKLEIFLMVSLEAHLISVFPSGIMRLEQKLSSSKTIPLAYSDDNIDKTNIQSNILSSKKSKDINSNRTSSPSIESLKAESNDNKYIQTLILRRKLAKLKNNPYSFFRDSKIRVLTPIRHLFH